MALFPFPQNPWEGLIGCSAERSINTIKTYGHIVAYMNILSNDVAVRKKKLIQSNLNGSNIFGTMEIHLRHG